LSYNIKKKREAPFSFDGGCPRISILLLSLVLLSSRQHFFFFFSLLFFILHIGQEDLDITRSDIENKLAHLIEQKKEKKKPGEDYIHFAIVYTRMKIKYK